MATKIRRIGYLHIPAPVAVLDDDAQDLQIAADAYKEYEDSGKISRPFAELLKELEV